MQQSPINIVAADMVKDDGLGKLDARYKAKINATIANDGHAVVVDLPPKSGALKIKGVTYHPAQFHFHMPSEHHIMNQSFPLEMHLVHKSEDGKLAVVGFLFVEGEESEFLAQFVDKLPSYKEPNVKSNIGKIRLLRQNRNYGRYMGSLTTPPCAENVTWTVMLWNFPTVSAHQLKLLSDSVPHTNNRPTFSSKGRNFHTSI
ncbi:hypothetical protein KC19_1G142100 [Ceratodon purpureus]|nr:hypothetical protein KC19_1G141900 [Ceratodon purpureus]KAG0591007.1 hypothetical protein KC19_1G142100 [Ceratodon purpureus]